MSRITHRRAEQRDADPIEHRLARLLDTSYLERVVPHLPPETLHQLIRNQGLEACGELVTSATPAQLTSLLDLDLWRHAQPGRDEQFDVERFGEWLEVLVETGDTVAARTVAALDTDLVIAGLSRYVRVFDPGTFEPAARSDDEPMDRAGAGLECEVGGYIVRAQRADAWDAIVALLVALEAEHGDDFHAVLQGCRRLSNSRPEFDGLDGLLPAPAQHLHDVAVARERRRSQQGYASPVEARAFLQMARQPTHTRSGASVTAPLEVNPLVAAYFRAADEELEPSEEPGSTTVRVDAKVVAESIDAVIALLTEAGMMPERPRALLERTDADPQISGLTRLRRLMEYVRDTDDAAYLTRGRELAFLANTLLAGCSVQARPFTPQEASDAAASICNLGLEYWPAPATPLGQGTGGGPATPRDRFPPDPFLIDHDLVAAFEVGWSVLHQDVSLFAAQQLISTLDDLHSIDRDLRRELVALRRTLVEQCEAGTPWLARGAAGVLAMLDATAWTGVLGLLDECPVLPAALTAILDGRTTRVSPTEFAFISTAAQVGDVRTFMRKLPDLLSG